MSQFYTEKIRSHWILSGSRKFRIIEVRIIETWQYHICIKLNFGWKKYFIFSLFFWVLFLINILWINERLKPLYLLGVVWKLHFCRFIPCFMNASFAALFVTKLMMQNNRNFDYNNSSSHHSNDFGDFFFFFNLQIEKTTIFFQFIESWNHY